MEWLDGLVENWVVGLNVRRDDGEGKVGKESTQLLITTVEFVVSEGHSIKPKLVDSLGNLLASVEGVVESTLELISYVQEQTVIVGWSGLVNDRLDSGITSKTSQGRVWAVCTA